MMLQDCGRIPCPSFQNHSTPPNPHSTSKIDHLMFLTLPLECHHANLPHAFSSRPRPLRRMRVSRSGIPFQDFSASVFPCLCGKPHVLSSLQPLVPLFALFSSLPSFVFNRLQPLSPKHPGVGVPALRLNLRTFRPSGVPTFNQSAHPIRNVDSARTSNYHCCKLKVPGPWMKPQN